MGRRQVTPAPEQSARRTPQPARRRFDERGVSAVEFALVLPILVMLLFGVTTAGLAYNDNLSISNAAREGARIGSALDYSTSPANWATSVQQRVEETYFNGANSLTDAQVCVRLQQWGGSAWSTVANTATASVSAGCGTAPQNPVTSTTNVCAVQVWIRKPATISLLVIPDMNIHIAAQAVSFYGRSVTGGCQAP